MTTTQEYLDAYRNSQKIKVEGLCGRIIRGKTPQDFERLSDDPSRLLVYLTDSEGLESLIGKRGYDQLVTIGHHPDHIVSQVSQGKSYKLVVFPEAEALVADWDGMLELTSKVYPETAPYCKKYALELKSWPFERYEALAGYRFKDVDDPANPKFMSFEKWQQSSKGLIHLRALLYHAIHVRELYRGDGYTYDENGTRGVKEYLLPNLKIEEIEGADVEDMTVLLPS